MVGYSFALFFCTSWMDWLNIWCVGCAASIQQCTVQSVLLLIDDLHRYATAVLHLILINILRAHISQLSIIYLTILVPFWILFIVCKFYGLHSGKWRVSLIYSITEVIKFFTWFIIVYRCNLLLAVCSVDKYIVYLMLPDVT